MMNYNTSSALIYSVQHMTFVYGVGYLGFHDCGAMSPYTMIDTAVVIFSVLFTVSALVRSWILRLIFLKLLDCVEVSQVLLHTHYFYFAIIPLSTEFLTANKLYVIYVYLNIILTTSGCLNMLTLTMAKLLHSEFRSVNTVYFVGLICCCGFGLSLPATVQLTSSSLILSGLNMGVNLIVPYLGALKVATIMWLYGVKRFSTDIQFWLGFNPTRYWKISWSVLPLVLLIQLIYTAIDYYNKPSSYFYEKLCALTWTAFSVLIVAIIQIVTLSKYMVGNKLASLFAANIKYGPPDPEDRKNRRNYSETIQLRRCKHSCQRLDDIIDCNDMPLMTSGLETTSSSASLTQDIYRAESLVLARGTSIRNPSLADLSRHQQ